MCSRDTFRRVWFAFEKLVDLSAPMTCPECGPLPSIIIADGVSAGYGRRQQSDALRPPTTRKGNNSWATRLPGSARFMAADSLNVPERHATQTVKEMREWLNAAKGEAPPEFPSFLADALPQAEAPARMLKLIKRTSSRSTRCSLANFVLQVRARKSHLFGLRPDRVRCAWAAHDVRLRPEYLSSRVSCPSTHVLREPCARFPDFSARADPPEGSGRSPAQPTRP